MSNKAPTPSWQRAQAPNPTSPPSQEPAADQPPEPSPAPAIETPTADEDGELHPDSGSLLEQASRFLEDPTIRDAPREKKVAFLQSKGVQEADIEQLLGAASYDEMPDISEEGERVWSQAPSTPTRPALPQPQPQLPEIPPIVTYPEFLTQSTNPPPIITTQRLLGTAYITGGLAATMYGLSKFIIAPMSDTLTVSRHDFAAHAREQLEEFNKRLGDVVSIDPANGLPAKLADMADDVSEADSDPTELFHRDYGTQTTPSLSRRPSVSSTHDDNSVVTGHENRLKILTSHLKELEASRANDNASSDSLKTKLSDFTMYLSELTYQSQHSSGMGGFYGGNYALPRGKDGTEDPIDVLKSDIRAVKGVFLSARNFPAGGRNPPPLSRVGV
ncbi:peroxisomal membrane anchor protein conserved region-domain-containing protein [Massariosphaeria phaeospora]|uniref:Peroxisomal membrane protein PEX14 n=1 Tax=Massariosphaeria phaeospora TaxID=100035 RepID=A0A7C8MES4_9PLEO|nr:peroxisomal membrane anchor protein conserved region-domain-containing protein [Massariosphaeria phaeospora]